MNMWISQTSSKQYREQVLERFEHTPQWPRLQELEAILDNDLFHDFGGLSQTMDYFVLAADELVKKRSDYDLGANRQLIAKLFPTADR